MKNYLAFSPYSVSAATMTIIFGLISYFTADGVAVIGQNPISVDVQKNSIIINTFWHFVFFVALGFIERVVKVKKHGNPAMRER